MKKFIILLPVILTLLVCLAFSVKKQPVEQPINKSINLSIYRENNYSSAAYDSTIASIHVTVYKVVDNKCTPVCDKLFSGMQLKQFPEMQNALNHSITIPNIMNSKEKLLIYYDVIYNTRGSELTLSNYMYTNAVKKDNLKINI